MRKKKDTIERSTSEKRRLEAAEKDFRKMWEEVKPFVKKRITKEYSTIGEWTTPS